MDRTRVSVARWCEDVARAGLDEIRTLAESAPPPAREHWRRVEVIADTCQRIPCGVRGHGPVADIRLRRALRRAWSATPAEGRRWLRHCSDSLDYPVPRPVGRLLRDGGR
ncbi:hypothetical protein NPS70_01475 [Streptomyces sp. C10-9-1]|uniref:hypothetical protein n=1 Tax=Streptomyces sp. C10-9-1 TaxID=1859285 RepID=UPI0021113B1D|nr:hypothetical protein [Streptomyces sp. C10-9-1]MCQ6551878.1 hypothetical protein [Streptomyces sp. C10-9-1]